MKKESLSIYLNSFLNKVAGINSQLKLVEKSTINERFTFLDNKDDAEDLKVLEKVIYLLHNDQKLSENDDRKTIDFYNRISIKINSGDSNKILIVKNKNDGYMLYLFSRFRYLEKNLIQERQLLLGAIVQSLCSSFEQLILAFYEEALLMKKDGGVSEKTLKFSEINDFNDVNEIKKYLVKEKIAKNAYKSFRNWFKIVIDECANEKYETLLKKDRNFKELIEKVAEIYATRNIFVHNNSIINMQYIQLSKNSEAKVGETKSIGFKYTQETANYFLRLFFKFLVLLNEKNDVFKKQDFFDNSLDQMINCMQEYPNEIGELIHHILKKISNDQYNYDFKNLFFVAINLWLCFKFSDENLNLDDVDFVQLSQKFKGKFKSEEDKKYYDYPLSLMENEEKSVIIDNAINCLETCKDENEMLNSFNQPIFDFVRNEEKVIDYIRKKRYII
ncbi:hypothetical protein LB941_06170 [Ligilactobacillus sp. WILCCON 0076]|uniref:Uncharacterized protein n=1 Tax=Ligilactobacillus ubinensis TaxID=2876789 RepID=A0A9X2JLD8_9LACO|nr:hypothetical protein [Ligilactobacillus ubinensis]MCP0886917.1 hypothetical protein [Ligilactobacillus ubinensis]